MSSEKKAESDGWISTFVNVGQIALKANKDPVADYFGEKSSECYKALKDMSLIEMWNRSREFSQIIEKKKPMDNINAIESGIVECLNNLNVTRYMYFANFYKIEQNCKDLCESEFPKGSGTINFINRHSCLRKCEDQYTKNVQPVLQGVMKKIQEDEEKARVENL